MEEVEDEDNQEEFKRVFKIDDEEVFDDEDINLQLIFLLNLNFNQFTFRNRIAKRNQSHKSLMTQISKIIRT